MKKVIFFLICICIFLSQSVQADERFKFSYKQDINDAKVRPLPFLIRSLKKNPKKNEFIIDFYAYGPSDLYKSRVNYRRKEKVLYVRTERVGWSCQLKKYSKVGLSDITRLYYESNKYSWSSDDNFNLLGILGFPTQVIFKKMKVVNPTGK